MINKREIATIEDVGELKKRAAEKRAEEYFDTAGIMMIVLDGKGNIGKLNKKGAEVIGYENAEEVVGKPWFDTFVPEEDRAKTKAAFAQIMSGKIAPVEYFENQIVDKNGKKILIAFHNVLLRDSNGKIIGTLSAGEDITERKIAEEEIRTTKERYKIALESAKMGSWELDLIKDTADKRDLKHDQIFGYKTKQKEWGQKIFLSHILSDDRQEVIRAFENAIKTGRLFFICRIVWPDKSIHWITATGEVVYSGDKKPIKIFGTVQDITERKKAEETEREIISIIEKSNDAILEKTLTGKITLWNTGAERLYGYKANEIIGKSIYLIVPKRLHKETEDILVKAKNGIKIENYETIRVRKDGKEIQVSLSIFPLKEGNLVKGVGVIARDITEWKKAEEEVKVSEEKFRNMVASSPMGMHLYSLDEKGRLILTDANPAASKILNVDCSKLVGKTIEEAFPGLKDTKIPSDYKNVIKTGKLMFIPKVEYHYGKISGFYDVYAFRTSNKSMVAAFLDITERIREEEAVRESEGKYHSMIDNTTDLVQSVDMNGNILFVNKAWKKALGYKNGQVSKLNVFRDIIAPSDLEHCKKIFARLMKGELVKNIETTFVAKDKRQIFVEGDVSLNRDEKGKIISTHGIWRDVTEKRKAEEKLKESEKMFKDMAETSPLAIYMSTGIDQKADYINPKFVQLFGYTIEDVPTVGHWWPRAYPDKKYRQQIIKEWQDKVKRAIKTKRTIEPMDVIVTCKDGSTKNVIWGFISLGDTNFAFGLDITERKKADEGLKSSENKFRTIFENANDGIIMADSKTKKFIFANDKMCRLTGYSLGELITLGVEKIHPKKDLPYVFDQFEKQLQRKIDVAKDLPVLRKDGKVIYCDVNSAPGNIEGREILVGFFRDVTDTKKAEEELKKSEERYKFLYETSNDAIMTIEPPDWGFTSGNSAAFKMFNTKDEKEFTSLKPWQVSPEKQPDGQLSSVKAKEMIMKAMKEGKSFFEWTHKRYNGEIFSATVLLSRVELDGKKFLQATVRNISEQKKAEEEQKKSAAELIVANKEKEKLAAGLVMANYAGSLIEASLDPLVTIAPNGKITSVNKATIKVTGVSRKKLIGTDFSDYFTEPDKAKAGYKEVFKKGFIEGYPLTIKHKNGKQTDVIYNASIYKNSEGQVIGIFAAAIDITKQKKVEHALEEANTQLHRIDTAKTEFLSSASHELKSPIVPVYGYLQMLSKGELGELNKEQAEAMNICLRNVESLNRLIENMLDVSKLELNKIALDKTRFDLGALVKEISQNFKPSAKERYLDLHVQAPASLMVIADKLRITQVISNFVKNALFYAPGTKDKTKKVTIGVAEGDTTVKVSVADEGPGISKEDQARLFNKFVQLKHAESSSHGSGLGLYISKAFIQLHGGVLVLKSEVGKGSTFSFTIPKGTKNGKDNINR